MEIQRQQNGMTRRLAGKALATGAGAWALGLRAQQRYAATREALAARPTPAWFGDAKFGIFIVWGLYSVPAFAPKGRYAEWYWNRVVNARKKNDLNDPFLKFHNRVYGPGFEYDQFIPMFKAEFFDPDEWADLVFRSGAKYVAHSAKYHDGFCLWPSAEASRSWGKPWNSVETGPKRDLVGELAIAGRKRGLRMGLYYSLYEWFNPYYLENFAKYRDQVHFPQFKDMVSRYRPSMIFADGQWEHSFEEWRSADLLSWLFNESPVKDEVAVNDRWGGKRAIEDQSQVVVGYPTSEYEKGFEGGPIWEENRGMGASYGYNRYENTDDYRSVPLLIRLLIDVVSRGGNLLLDIGPSADGRIPVEMQDRMVGIGNWLKVNGDAIYGTTAGPIRPPEPGGAAAATRPDHAPTPADEEKLNKLQKWSTTAKKGKVYVHVFERPANGVLVLPALNPKVARGTLLDGGTPVKVVQTSQQLAIHLPPCLPDPVASVVTLETA